MKHLLRDIGVAVNVIAPMDASPADLARLGDADFNIVLYPEIAGSAANWLQRTFKQPIVKAVPIGIVGTRAFVEEVATLAGLDASDIKADDLSRLPWYSKSVDSTYLTNKRVFIFGDATHAIAAARIASRELGFKVVGLGTYSREFAREVREAATSYGVEALITDDYLAVEEKIQEAAPELVLGTQMERHIAKRLGLPCAVISAPVHVQDFPARYSPQMGFEGANVIFDTWVHPLMMGLEEHLLSMFRDDFEFHDDAAPSHLGSHKTRETPPQPEERDTPKPAPVLGVGASATTWRRTPRRNSIAFHFSFVARRAATPSASLPSVAFQQSPLRRCMMQKHISADSPTPIRVVIVTLDQHLAGTFERARGGLAAEIPGLDVSMHAAALWGHDPKSLARCIDDINSADIIVASMLFMEDHIEAVLPALKARRDNCDAIIGAMSAGEIMRLTRIGNFKMDGSDKGAMSLLKKLRGSKKKDCQSSASGASQMAMLRRIPKILKYIPGTAQDVRAYFLTLQYWLAGSEENLINMVRFLVDRYSSAAKRLPRGRIRAEAPAEYPDVGVYHPRMAGRITTDAARLPKLDREIKGTVGVLVMRSYLLASNTAHYDGVIDALEARGLRAVTAFATGLDARPAVESYFQKDGHATVDAIVSLTGFSLVGGPAYNDAKAADTMLTGLDVPYIAAHALEFQSLEQWGRSERGLAPVEATIMVAIPELDGATGPMVFGGRSDGSEHCTGCRRKCALSAEGATHVMHSCPERAEMLAARVEKLVALRRAERAERRLAIVLFNFPPNGGAVGTAAFLAVFESLFNTLKSLRASGYSVELPTSVDELRKSIIEGNAQRFGTRRTS